MNKVVRWILALSFLGILSYTGEKTFEMFNKIPNEFETPTIIFLITSIILGFVVGWVYRDTKIETKKE